MKDNKLIAEFMGWEEETFSYNDWLAYFTPHKTEAITPEGMEFSTSWDWLMDVVKYIKEGISAEEWFDSITGEIATLRNALLQVNHQAVYIAIVDVIKYYPGMQHES